MISAYVSSCHRQWDQYLQQFAYALKTAVHDTTGKTPCELFLGRQIMTPCEKLLYVQEQQNKFRTRDIEEIIKEVQNTIKKAQATQKKNYDKKRAEANIQIGQEVLKERHTLSNLAEGKVSKFENKYQGPYIVIEVRGNNLVIQKNNETPIVVNVDQVRVYHDRSKSKLLKELTGYGEEERDISHTNSQSTESASETQNSAIQNAEKTVNQSESEKAENLTFDKIKMEQIPQKNAKKRGREQQTNGNGKELPKAKRENIPLNIKRPPPRKITFANSNNHTHPFQTRSKARNHDEQSQRPAGKRVLIQPSYPPSSRKRLAYVKQGDQKVPILPTYFHRKNSNQRKDIPQRAELEPRWMKESSYVGHAHKLRASKSAPNNNHRQFNDGSGYQYYNPRSQRFKDFRTRDWPQQNRLY